eukprot:CAMPEP_0181341386 /NCGR_PEP_ID=MMETSP1101-20121128/30385_1 /TAXON_ID=46948 /ORGANISM="Rhodomonas abbreviata, Strain Caron Lab Isolate" /LENGTH=148 /DNA_ID=CAMNT_0023452665 /DNA_START=224 /DNA_END=667 /DNA_ORIENTATION=-
MAPLLLSPATIVSTPQESKHHEHSDNLHLLKELCQNNQNWDAFFNQLYAIKVVENIDRNILGNSTRADRSMHLADQVAQTLEQTPLSSLKAEDCLQKIRHYIDFGNEPFASDFLQKMEKRLHQRMKAAEEGWACIRVLAEGTHSRLGQ